MLVVVPYRVQVHLNWAEVRHLKTSAETSAILQVLLLAIFTLKAIWKFVSKLILLMVTLITIFCCLGYVWLRFLQPRGVTPLAWCIACRWWFWCYTCQTTWLLIVNLLWNISRLSKQFSMDEFNISKYGRNFLQVDWEFTQMLSQGI